MPEVVLAAPAPDFGRLDNADEGFVPFRPGDYVVTESVPGEAWVIERYAFEASYERIP